MGFVLDWDDHCPRCIYDFAKEKDLRSHTPSEFELESQPLVPEDYPLSFL